jgi:cytochrome c biogenesis protein CcdA
MTALVLATGVSLTDLFLPFAAGMVATVNPCGFAMLPAYLAFFVGNEKDESNPAKAIPRAMLVGLAMTLAFVTVFGLFGLIFSSISSFVGETVLPVMSIVIGAALLLLGIAMLFGFEPNFGIPKLNKGGKTRSLGSMYVFGLSFALASLGCTVGPFLGIVGLSTTASGDAAGASALNQVSNFVAYAVGMGAVVLALTLAAAVAQTSVARNLRRVLPYVNRISAVFLVIAGVYVVTYGILDWQIQRFSVVDNPGQEPPSNALEEWGAQVQSGWSNWFSQNTGRLGWIFLLMIAASLLYAFWGTLEQGRRRFLVSSLAFVYIAMEAAYRLWPYDLWPNKATPDFNGIVDTNAGIGGGDLLIGSVVRWIIEWPLRVVHWFTDPLRFGVLVEIGLLAAVGWMVWNWLKPRVLSAQEPEVGANAESAMAATADSP